MIYCSLAFVVNLFLLGIVQSHSLEMTTLRPPKHDDLRIAVVEVELLEYSRRNTSLIKSGVTKLFNASFSRIGTRINVESGFLRQMHICQNEYDWAPNSSSWVAVFKLESSVRSRHRCVNVITKAKLAITNRASAVIFDVTDDKNISKVLNKRMNKIQLTRPVLIVRGRAAQRLQLLMQTYPAALASIKLKSNKTDSPRISNDVSDEDFGYWSLVISSVVVGCLSSAAILLIIKVLSAKPPIKEALEKMKLVTYTEVKGQNSDTQCTICYDEYLPNEVVRLLPCLHFFHRKCVDKWLLLKKTCPLCLYDVVSGSTTHQMVRNAGTNSSIPTNQPVNLAASTANPSEIPRTHCHFMPLSRASSLALFSLQPPVFSFLPFPSHRSTALQTSTTLPHSNTKSLIDLTSSAFTTLNTSIEPQQLQVSSSIDIIYHSASSINVSTSTFHSKHSNTMPI